MYKSKKGKFRACVCMCVCVCVCAVVCMNRFQEICSLFLNFEEQ